METQKFSKDKIDSVRGIEGFPIAEDDSIVKMSKAPYCTACPNPFLGQFIETSGTVYDEDTDSYHKEPFASDVSEGKSDAIYNVHSYHTKVPHKAIMRYILHYTKPGDIVYDGFCGSGMTGVAAQLCGDEKVVSEIVGFKKTQEVVGNRKAILSDLSPAATFTALNYNYSVDVAELKRVWNEIIKKCKTELGWVYKTKPSVEAKGQTSLFDSEYGSINYSVWSDLLICPNCGEKFVFWDVAVDEEKGKVKDKFNCPHCNVELGKKDCEKAKTNYIDDVTGELVTIAEQKPVLINYDYAGKKYDKKPDDDDLQLIKTIDETVIPYWYPTDKMMHIGEKWGDSYRSGYHAGISRVHQFFTKRTLFILSFIFEQLKEEDDDIRRCILSAVKSSFSYGTKMIKVNVGRILNGGGLFAMGAVSGTLYIPSLMAERNILDAIDNKIKNIIKLYSTNNVGSDVYINTGSSTDLRNIPENSIDYIFTDPPFGDNLNYSELNFLWEAWEGVFTNNGNEAIMNNSQKKGVYEYQELMTRCFEENFRILKPGRWMTVEFHNSKNNVWNAIQEALLKAGFVIADVRTLDKQQGSFKQVTNTTSVKQDLVISTYKPKESFIKEFIRNAGSEESAWSFVRQHLANIPVVVLNGEKIEIVAERQGYLLFDRMVAYHIMRGIAVPIDASEFYKGLDEKFLKRDGMYFLADQVNEYDTARIQNDVEPIQFSFIVSNEKTAIAWLYQQLSDEYGGAKTYSEIQPKFMQEVKSVDKFEAMPELQTLLEENFLQDDGGKWYVPDVTKEGDVAKLREKKLLKEFEGYLQSKGKLKLFRSEAIRVGFSKLWKDKNYQAIVNLAERLPEQTIQEDPNLLMYYDISLSRV